MASILITGGTGLIGKALTLALIERDHHVIILTRQLPKAHYGSKVSFTLWDVRAQTIDREAVAKADHIIHLAGANVAEKRWTASRKKEIVESRVKSAELLVKSLKEIPNKIQSVTTASGIGWYGPDPQIPNTRPFTEEDPAYDDFLGQTCVQWERSLEPVSHMGKRLVKLRTGIVLSRKGGAMKEFLKPLQFGVASILGDGRQVMSWIHIDDLVKLYINCFEDDKKNGVYNAVAPFPVSNKEMVLALARAKKGKFFVPVHVPVFVLKAVLGDMSVEVLKSATVSSAKLHAEGFRFQFEDHVAAMNDLFS